MILDDMCLNDLLELYKRKKALLQDGNLSELIKLKLSCPELFIDENEREVNQLLDTTKYLMEMPHFKALIHEEKKRRLIPLDSESWQMGALTEIINQYERISYTDIHYVARELVKDAIVTCRSICQEQKNNITLPEIFPLLGLLISEILILFPQEKREHRLKLAMFKLRGKDLPIEKSVAIEKEMENSCDSFIKDKVRNCFSNMFKKIILKFDQRKEFYNDSLFFCLIEVTDFIGLLVPNIGSREGEAALVISRIEKNILIYET